MNAALGTKLDRSPGGATRRPPHASGSATNKVVLVLHFLDEPTRLAPAATR